MARDSQSLRQTDRQTVRQDIKETDRQTVRQTIEDLNRRTDRCTDRQNNSLTLVYIFYTLPMCPFYGI